ncbi:hypothetical protein SZN_36017 [Streptomyces zinciresistens K42]|uniref:Uncharacterized protein n=1 Tax=Streptomyces zinciresistens K42 TaxID=700597 RepID=G2GNU8_9ACTN|nr:hypothetical protein SZN_36017 [Streptomyces zinciresistens K42]
MLQGQFELFCGPSMPQKTQSILNIDGLHAFGMLDQSQKSEIPSRSVDLGMPQEFNCQGFMKQINRRLTNSDSLRTSVMPAKAPVHIL